MGVNVCKVEKAECKARMSRNVEYKLAKSMQIDEFVGLNFKSFIARLGRPESRNGVFGQWSNVCWSCIVDEESVTQ